MFLSGYLLSLAIVGIIIHQLVQIFLKSRSVECLNGPDYLALPLSILYKKKDEDIFFLLQKFTTQFPRLFRLWFLNKLMVVTDDCDIIQRVLTSRELLHKPDVFYNVLNIPLGLVGSEYSIWRQHRKVLNPTFNQKILESFMPVFVENSRKLADEIDKKVEQTDFDVMHITMKYTLQAVFGTTMGFEGMTQTSIDKICAALRTVLKLIGIRIFNVVLLPGLIYRWTNCWNGMWWKEQNTRKYLHEVVNAILLEKQAKFDGSHIQDEDSLTKPQLFINQLISLSEDKKRGIQLTNEEIHDECYIMVAGGTETSALAVSYMCLLLAQNPHIQDKVLNEINDEYPSFGEPLTLAILNRMTYLEMAIKETMRLIPIIPFIGREVRSDFDLGPCQLKEDTIVIINIYALHRRKDIWGEDAKEYNPDRFLPEHMAKRHSYAYIPFSGGARNCIGNRYAMMSMKTMMIYILKNFEISTKLKLHEFRYYFMLTLHLFNKHMITVRRRHTKGPIPVRKNRQMA